MSKVSGKAEHLIRAAVKAIKRHPKLWDQRSWARFVPECGTTYCIGGWMLLYDGWKHQTPLTYRPTWTKGDMRIVEPCRDYLAPLVYGDGSQGFTGIGASIFARDIHTIGELVRRIEEDLEINFEEECPCLAEPDHCILQGCPCGVHTGALKVEATPDLLIANPMGDVIKEFVRKCQEGGDRITERQVLADEILMAAFRKMFLAGETSLITTVTRKAERRIEEVRLELQAMTRSRDEVIRRNSELQLQSQAQLQANLKHGGALMDPLESDRVIRKLQGQVDQLRDGSRHTPEFRKMKATLNRVTEENAALRLNNASLVKQTRAAQTELSRQKVVVKGLHDAGFLTQARQEGFRKAVAAWQQALDIVKKQENL